MSRLTGLLVLTISLVACSDGIVEYEITSAAIEQFTANVDTLSARDDANSPLAMSVLASNQIGAPEGVQIWNPEETLAAVGINNADLIALVNDQVPSREYGHSFAATQKPFANATQQYVHFVSSLLAIRHSQDEIVLAVHPQYRTRAEREEHGSLHTKEPQMIRIIFR